jgi:hypothetical protein
MRVTTKFYAAIVGLLFFQQANAAIIPMTLSDVRAYDSVTGTEIIALLTNSTATFEYDDSTNLLTQTGGTFDVTFYYNNNYDGLTLHRHVVEGFVVGNGAPAVGDFYGCVNGVLFEQGGINVCEFLFLSQFDGFQTQSWDGSTLVIGNGPLASFPCTVDCEPLTWRWTLDAQVVPVPAAVWLLGSALGVLGWIRGRATR